MINFSIEEIDSRRDLFISEYSNYLQNPSNYRNPFISDSISQKFIKSTLSNDVEELNISRNFANISLFIDSKTESLRNSLKGDFSKESKQLLTELTFSAYEKLSTELPDKYSDFDNFYNKLNDIKGIYSSSFSNLILGQNNNMNILFKETLEKLDSRESRLKALTYSHEEVHNLGNSEENMGTLNQKGKSIFSGFNYSTSSLSFLDDALTEGFAEDFVNLNHSALNEHFHYNIKLENDSELHYFSSRVNYKEGHLPVDFLKSLVDDKLYKAYFLEDNNISKELEDNPKLLNSYLKISDSYNEYLNDFEKSSYPDEKLKNIEKIYNLCDSLVNFYDNFTKDNCLTSDKMKDFLNNILKNPIYIRDSNTSLNEALAMKVFIKYCDLGDVFGNKSYPEITKSINNCKNGIQPNSNLDEFVSDFYSNLDKLNITIPDRHQLEKESIHLQGNLDFIKSKFPNKNALKIEKDDFSIEI